MTRALPTHIPGRRAEARPALRLTAPESRVHAGLGLTHGRPPPEQCLPQKCRHQRSSARPGRASCSCIPLPASLLGGKQHWAPGQAPVGCRGGLHGVSRPLSPTRRVWKWSWQPSPDSSPSLSPRLESPPVLFLDTGTCQQQGRQAAGGSWRDVAGWRGLETKPEVSRGPAGLQKAGGDQAS